MMKYPEYMYIVELNQRKKVMRAQFHIEPRPYEK